MPGSRARNGGAGVGETAEAACGSIGRRSWVTVPWDIARDRRPREDDKRSQALGYSRAASGGWLPRAVHDGLATSKDESMSYLIRHWRGELSLPLAFWVNFVALNLLLLALRPVAEQVLMSMSLDDDPRLMARVALLHVGFVYGLIYPWQIVGVWRSAGRWLAEREGRVWPVASRTVLVLSIAGTGLTVAGGAAVYRDIVTIALGPDRYADYTLQRVGDGSLVRFQGYLGYGAARDLRQVLVAGPEVQGIILDSPGGWIASGRSMGRVIADHGLNTYSFEGCHSACTTAFIFGRNRYLADEARLGFHQYAVPFGGLESYSNMWIEQQRDLHHFRNQGVSASFLARLFQAEHGDAWYPTQRELLAARVISGVVRSEEVLFGVAPGNRQP